LLVIRRSLVRRWRLAVAPSRDREGERATDFSRKEPVMATQQTTSRGGKKASPRGSQRGDTGRSAPRASRATSERDETYGLISVIYHALQGAETCEKYADDARAASNDELMRFFEECRDEQNRRALEARRLLAAEFRDLDDEIEEMIDDDDS
jgi:hypothetical protein